MTTPLPSSASLAERLGVATAVGTVVRRQALSPNIVEVVVGGSSALAGVPGNDVMVLVPLPDGGATRRRYSVRSVDERADTITLWICTNHVGPGATWATTAPLGSTIDVVGPRGKITLDPMADWHLFIGDTASLGSFYRLAASIETPGKAIFIVEVDEIDDALTAVFDEGLGVTGIFVERRGRAYHDPAGLLAGLAAFALPEHEGVAYVFAEFSTTTAIALALGDRGIPADRIRTKSFYRTGRANATNGEPDKSS